MPIDANHVALVIEGGGMRNSYTAACIHELITHGINFGWVGGISAGASHTVNFLSRDARRTRESFVEFGADPRTGGIRSMMRGTGFFNAEYIYETAGAPDNDLPFDWETFLANPTPFRIGATRADNGETVYWGRDDVHDLPGLMKRVRASSTLPGLMPVPSVDGVEYVDGALGASGGLIIDAALSDGFEKFLVLRTKPRGYVRPPLRSPRLVRQLLRKRPAVAEAMIARPDKYNAAANTIAKLEQAGQAKVFYPENMRVSNTERRLSRLMDSWRSGMEQTHREWDDWMAFLQD
ncbi:patatin-like phospholipase family protein [Corynebacterium auriscanis]|uniref:patatin-like phospholipase family protein n=1 Tax=Corynebacterium auriscanis TaxID=99807 RepID=UPI002246D46F|nr:patatin family protein [Corynebacterium auriscanis]MCX2162403.1 patatin family protein [Corynebacterium auriscanis]